MLTCAILAGGFGSRMLPRTAYVPKALVPVAGRPFLDHQVSWLRAQRVTRVVLCVRHLSELIQQFTGDGSRWGIEIQYSFDGPSRLGTAGALRLAIEHGQLNGRFLTLYGDCLPELSVGECVRSWEASGLPAMMTVFRPTRREDASARLQGNLVTVFDRTPTAAARRHLHHADYGLHGFDSSIIVEQVRLGALAGLGAVHGALASARQLHGIAVAGPQHEIGSESGLREMEHFLADHG